MTKCNFVYIINVAFLRTFFGGDSLLDLKKLLDGSHPSLDFEYSLDLNSLPEDIVSGTAVATGKVTDHSGYMVLEGVLTVNAKAICARCGEEFDYVQEFPLFSKLTLKLEGEDTEEFIVIKDSAVDVEEFAGNTLLLDLPYRFLCSEDCKGLCGKCGCNLNKGTCTCTDKEHDPRWDAILSYFD